MCRGTTASLRAISTVDALIALQGVEDPTERKKRAVAKDATRSTCSTRSSSGCPTEAWTNRHSRA
ncbi:MAG: flagellar assembly protein FliX [Sphingobacteriales bacterium]